jgi:hypothetical protein
MVAKSLIQRLFRPKHDYLPGTTVFRELDVDLIAREMDLESLGDRDGKAGVPAATSKRPSAVENEILRRVKGYWEEAAQGARRAHEAYSSRALSLGGTTDIDTVRGLPRSVASVLSQTARSAGDELSSLFNRWREADASFARFKAAEGIQRPVRLQKPMGVKLFWLIAGALLELAVNTSIFAAGDEFGIAGALLKVVAIPALNMGVTFILVLGVARHILRRPIIWKLVGSLGILLAISWAFTLNLAVAHWRDSLDAAMSIDAGRLALERIVSATFELNSVNSWLLFAIGCLAAGFAAYDATIWTDPFPGFAKHAEEEDEAAAAFQAARKEALEELARIADDANEKLREALRNAETYAARGPEFALRAQALAEDLRLYAEHLQSVAEDLTTRYREANQRARTTPAPGRFDEGVSLRLATVTLPPIKVFGGGAELNGMLASAMHEITVAHDAAASQIPTLTELSQGSPRNG